MSSFTIAGGFAALVLAVVVVESIATGGNSERVCIHCPAYDGCLPAWAYCPSNATAEAMKVAAAKKSDAANAKNPSLGCPRYTYPSQCGCIPGWEECPTGNGKSAKVTIATGSSLCLPCFAYKSCIPPWAYCPNNATAAAMEVDAAKKSAIANAKAPSFGCPKYTYPSDCGCIPGWEKCPSNSNGDDTIAAPYCIPCPTYNGCLPPWAVCPSNTTAEAMKVAAAKKSDAANAKNPSLGCPRYTYPSQCGCIPGWEECPTGNGKSAEAAIAAESSLCFPCSAYKSCIPPWAYCPSTSR